MKITEDELVQIITVITSRTGIIPREGHKDGIRAFVEKRLDNLKSLNPLQTYRNLLETDNTELTNLVNESTVNETYFFREEKQFSFLKDVVFPEWIEKNGAMPIKIWCAACSTGEEAYSLAMMTKLCRIKSIITASDIDTNVLKVCSEGKYRAQSKRIADGKSFHELLTPYMTPDGNFVMSDELKSCVQTRYVNLAALEDLSKLGSVPLNQNVIFLRNVFIYFKRELRASILKTIGEKCLAQGGYLFVSMSEVASIDSEITPDSLQKQVKGNVFYFQKK